MKKILCFIMAASMSAASFAQWNPGKSRIRTKWADEISPDKVWAEYPRPVMERSEWKNLNGLWDYAIRQAGASEPETYDGKILVPFAVESNLSGVEKNLGKNKELWYRRTFAVPATWKNREIMLNFGAVDWKADVFVNGIKIGSHTGGYTPFSFDVTPYLSGSGEQKLVVRAWDPGDESYQPKGKQVNKPEGIWYTSVSGIWQTVWLEPVAAKHVSSLFSIPDIDANRLSFNINTAGTFAGDILEITVKDGNKAVASGKFAAGQKAELSIPEPKLWSPDSPFLYDVEISLHSAGKLLDKVKSYAAMRKISVRKENDIVRMQLNNKDIFQLGPLDQGWWPDGLYTAPCDEALIYDVQKTKDFGYNMIRKHVKVEPARWYTHCDRVGIIVWQDMPSGGNSPHWQTNQFFDGKEAVRPIESEQNFRKEWQEIMDFLKPYPCIAVWVPFNEAWGQFKCVEIAQWTKFYDPTRLVNPASGGNHYIEAGDITDIHSYPAPSMFLYNSKKVNVLGEYGGIGLAVEGHLWQPDKNWGYVQYKNSKDVTDEYIKFAEILKPLVKRGFSAAVYTQTTDVEGEINGLITYDRKVIKLEEDRLKKINREVISGL